MDFGAGFFLLFNVGCLDFASLHRELGNCKSDKQKAHCAFLSRL